MHKPAVDERLLLRPMFAGYRPFPVAVDAVLEGGVGSAVADDSDPPRCARLVAGPYAMFAGDAGSATALELVRGLRRLESAVVIGDPAWLQLVRRVYPSATVERRQAFSFAGLDRDRLASLREVVAPGVRIVPVDAGSLRRLEIGIGPGMLGVYATPEELVRQGFGYAAVVDGREVCGAVSAIASSSAVEIQIMTADAYRRRGLATAVSAAMALRCLDDGIEPHWSTSNPASRRLADRLGYTPGARYEWLRIGW